MHRPVIFINILTFAETYTKEIQRGDKKNESFERISKMQYSNLSLKLFQFTNIENSEMQGNSYNMI